MKPRCRPSSLLVSLLLLTTLLGVQARNRDKEDGEDEGGSSPEGDYIVTTTRNESHATASAFASVGGASASASTDGTSTTLRVVNGESEDEEEESEDESPKKKSKTRKQKTRNEESNVPERVRDAILNANVDRVASLLSRINETDLLGLGFTFPAHLRDENLIFTDNRTMDPDVVALKGMAKAALEGDLSKKLTEVFITAVYGPDFDENVCFEAPDFTYSSRSRVETKNRTVIKSGYRSVTNDSGTFTTEDDKEILNSVSQDMLFEETNVDFEEADASPASEDEDEDEDEVCYTKEEIKAIRKNLRKDFRDVELMTSIVEGDPEGVSRRQRALLILSTPADTWLCSSCWKKKFCNKNVYWCPQ